MTAIAAPAEDDPQQRRALARFGAVNWIAQAIQNGLSLTGAVHAAAQQAWDGRLYAPSTLEEWYYRHTHGGFKALHDQPRSDRGTHRALDPSATEALLSLRRQHPELTVETLAKRLVQQDILIAGAYSMSTLYRRLHQAGLDGRSLKAGSAMVSGPTKAFELPLPNMLWMADCMHGPTLSLADGSRQRTFLFSVIDDCSRLCAHGQYYDKERTECFLDTLRRALQSRGVPEKLYTDNGGPFRSQHLAVVCANFNIRLLHARPYHAWSKGKQEKFFRTVQQQFQQSLVFAPAGSLQELNQRFWEWLETDYHQRVHSGLSGQSPRDRFAQGLQTLRPLPTTIDWQRLFLMRQNRRVRKDATVSLQGQLFEVPTVLRGRQIVLEYEPIGLQRVDVYVDGSYHGPAKRCDKHLNARISSSNTYERGQH